ncbi:hypothetical protein ABZ714_26505 [Streptomyces sp. NPDC006798]|uniref:hypothetical protein n=1 Tax=Streptomyces sp. NPDC006798 TaxID=3155462 RepID=UPI0033F39B7F
MIRNVRAARPADPVDQRDTAAQGVADHSTSTPWQTCTPRKRAAQAPQSPAELPISQSWRGWLLLHAGLQTDRTALRRPLVACTVRGRELPTGAVIGVARLTGCHHDPPGAPACTEFAEPGQWHLELTDVQALALPIPARGQLGAWKPTDDLISQVLQQLPGLRP